VSSAGSPHEDAVRAKLGRILGPEKAAHLLAELLREQNLATVSTADEVMRIAHGLQARGGLLGAIGTSLAVHAELHGATRT
jgi:hypothetical protein